MQETSLCNGQPVHHDAYPCKQCGADHDKPHQAGLTAPGGRRDLDLRGDDIRLNTGLNVPRRRKVSAWPGGRNLFPLG
jgi:hypothetical protein